MNKKVILTCFTILIAFILCGCSLAKDDGLDVESDHFIGVYVTPNHLDLFDVDQYLNDNLPSIMKNGGNEINILGQNDKKYSGRIYAVLKPTATTNLEDSEYVFEGVDGIPLFCPKIIDTNGESYTNNQTKNAVSKLNVSIVYETSEEMSLDSTIYIAPNGPNTLYSNPVYQSSDGKVYLMAGSGMGFIENDNEGLAFTQTLNEKQTVTENGKKTEKSFKVIVKAEIKYPAKSVKIISISAENTPLSSLDYNVDALPEKIEIKKDAAYVIIESTANSPNGKTIKRELINPSTEDFTSYVEGNDGICIPKSIALTWEK